MKIKPVGKRMLIEKAFETESPLIIPEGVEVNDDVRIGKVLAIGDEVTKYKVGDYFIYEKHVLTRFFYKGEECFFTEEKYPLAGIEM